MRLILIRHFRTQSNEARRIMGWGDAPPAKEWESDLLAVDARLQDRQLAIDAIHCSDLGRARHTALYFARRRGLEVVKGHAALNEVHYGELLGMEKEAAARAYPEFKNDPDFVFPGGESFRQMQARSLAQVQVLADLYPSKTLLLVAHAGVIRALVCHVLGLDLAGNLRRKVGHCYIGDFLFAGGRCLRYDELGQPSGFVRDGIIRLPWNLASANSNY